jgi:hypothetical protein
MITNRSLSLRPLAIVAIAALLAACSDAASPTAQPSLAVQPAPEQVGPVGTLKRATYRYHDLNVALADGFVFLHGCENRPGEGPVGTVYVHPGRLMDGVIDPNLPDALIYHTPRAGDLPRLLGVEFAIPYVLWTQPQPPQYLGNTFQSEDEFGVYGLHVWVWNNNPDGMFAEGKRGRARIPRLMLPSPG